MCTDAKIIPVQVYSYVDEPAEFQHFSNSTDARMRMEADRIDTDMRMRNRQRREARKERRRIARNFKLLCLGAVATCCAISAVLAWRSSYQALAIFPAALSVLSVVKGIRAL